MKKINKGKHLLSDKESDMQINKYRVTDNRKGKKNCWLMEKDINPVLGQAGEDSQEVQDGIKKWAGLPRPTVLTVLVRCCIHHLGFVPHYNPAQRSLLGLCLSPTLPLRPLKGLPQHLRGYCSAPQSAPVVWKFECPWKLPGGCVKIPITEPNPRESDSGGLGGSPRICISNKFSEDANAGTTLWEALH